MSFFHKNLKIPLQSNINQELVQLKKTNKPIKPESKQTKLRDRNNNLLSVENKPRQLRINQEKASLDLKSL